MSMRQQTGIAGGMLPAAIRNLLLKIRIIS